MTPETGILGQLKEFERKGLVSRLLPNTAPYVPEAPEARAALKRLADGGNERAREALERQAPSNVVPFPGYAGSVAGATSELEPPTPAAAPTVPDTPSAAQPIPARDRPQSGFLTRYEGR